MAVINPKQLEFQYHKVNSMLEKSMKHGEGWIVSKMHDRDEKKKSFMFYRVYIEKFIWKQISQMKLLVN